MAIRGPAVVIDTNKARFRHRFPKGISRTWFQKDSALSSSNSERASFREASHRPEGEEKRAGCDRTEEREALSRAGSLATKDLSRPQRAEGGRVDEPDMRNYRCPTPRSLAYAGH